MSWVFYLLITKENQKLNIIEYSQTISRKIFFAILNVRRCKTKFSWRLKVSVRKRFLFQTCSVIEPQTSDLISNLFRCEKCQEMYVVLLM